MRLRLFALFITIAPVFLHAQDSLTLYDKAYNLPDKLFGSIHNKSEKFQQSVLKATAKYMNKLQKQELKMKRKLMKTDSTAAEEIFGDVKGRYADLENNRIRRVEFSWETISNIVKAATWATIGVAI